MKCTLCNQGETHPGEVTVILKGVSADICENCGEYYLSETTARQIMLRAEESVKSGRFCVSWLERGRLG